MAEHGGMATDEALETSSLPERLHRLLRRRILNNELGAGTRLVEASLAAEFGVSRSTVRQALGKLEAEGLVLISPRRHSVVARMSAADVRDVCYARYVLEEGAARAVLAAGPPSQPPPDLTALFEPLASIVRRMADAAAAGDAAAMVDLDTEFHGQLVRASGKARLAELWATLTPQMGVLMRSSMEDQQLGLHEVAARHQQVLDALRSADPATVAAALYEHYLRAEHTAEAT